MQKREDVMGIRRRTVLQGIGATTGAAMLGAPVIAQARTKVRVGYLHTLAVDGQMWLANHLDAFGKNGFLAFALAYPTLLGAAAAALGWWRFRRGDLP